MKYDTHCLNCEHEWPQEHRMKDDHAPCPECGSKRVESVIKATSVIPPADASWEYDNGGRGRYIGQLEQGPSKHKSNFAYCRSMGELREKAKRVNMTVHKDAW